MFFNFFYVNLHFTYVYTPNIFLYPLNFKFLEITLLMELAWEENYQLLQINSV